MSFLIGEVVDFSFQVDVADVDTDATVVLTITVPDGSTVTPSLTHPSTGHYLGSYAPGEAGHYTWAATATGSAVSISAGAFDVFSPSPSVQPVTGLASPWTDAATLAARPEIAAFLLANPDGIETGQLADACRIASEILYALSGRQFAGNARTYIRPVARASGWDARSWGSSTAFGYWESWGGGYSMGYGPASSQAVGMHSGQSYPPEIPLSYPVTSIERVLIDGIVIPSAEYRVDDYRLLVRVRPTAASIPTARAAWPHVQHLDMPDTETGTFSVTYRYGVAPSPLGVNAALVLATEIALDMVGADSRLPSRVKDITRQGESMVVIDSLDSLKEGWTGIPMCDYFLRATNPSGLSRRGRVWSPDTAGRARTPTG